MRVQTPNRRRSSEAGVAMLIAIFVLLLIAIVGIALIVSSGTETALAGNYRSSSAAFYAALAGLEEGRGRLLPKNPDYFNGFVAAPGTVLPTGQVRYITNPANGGNVLTDYPDKGYDKEFGAGALAAANVNTIASVSTVAGIQGSLYQWVRINAVTEQSLNFDIDNNGIDPGLLYYDGVHLTSTPTASQALEITSLAVLPNGTQKLLQYVVAPSVIAPQPANAVFLFPAALTLVGNNVAFQSPNSTTFFVKGQDQTCTGTSSPALATAIGFTNSQAGDTSHATIVAGATPPANYPGESSPGAGGPPPPLVSPSIADVSGLLPQNWQTPSGLEQIVQDITKSADTILSPTVPPPPGTYATFTEANLPASMSASNPMTIVVNGNLNINNWHNTGYGLLVIRGELIYDPDATWDGIVLVIGAGKFVSTKSGSGQFNGAMLIANTRDNNGNLLAALGPASFSQTGNSPSGAGIYYSSCWVKAVQPVAYKVLSFREIPQ